MRPRCGRAVSTATTVPGLGGIGGEGRQRRFGPLKRERTTRRSSFRVRVRSDSAAQAAGFAPTHLPRIGTAERPYEGGFLQTTQNGAAARPRFESPVRRAAVVFLGPRRTGPFRMSLPKAP